MSATLQGQSESSHIFKGKIGEHDVQVLRDTGCKGVIVKKKFILDHQYTGREAILSDHGITSLEYFRS